SRISPPPAADPAVLATVGGLMREVVTSGTATVLAGVPGEPVHAKTGTAEHGAGDPPPTHAWTIGYQGTLAFAVLVEDGASGGSVAAPLAADFLTRAAALRP
ncbi:penicillin-binding transpeptidase domain-containing protein, partial [Kineococcus indalonis]|uniref:penicillin-binding transpeptidase domain-containing protein n=1 Tax=Kineococcus indalonis TaxID=2696566 RepID=UPI0023F33E49